MVSLSGTVPHPRHRGRVFRYEAFQADAERGTLTCGYSLDGREFTERVTLPPGPRWHTDAARACRGSSCKGFAVGCWSTEEARGERRVISAWTNARVLVAEEERPADGSHPLRVMPEEADRSTV